MKHLLFGPPQVFHFLYILDKLPSPRQLCIMPKDIANNFLHVETLLYFSEYLHVLAVRLLFT